MQLRKLILACVLAVVVLHSQTVSAEGKRYALIVAVKTYRPGQPLPELPFTENDATGLQAVLKDGGYQVTLMTQTVGRTAGKEVYAPLSDYIRDQVDALLDSPFLKDEDMVILAFTGHGVQYEFIEADTTKTPRFYFCPADADVTKLKTANDVTDRNRLIDLSELYQSLNKCKAGGKLLLVDACRNDPTKPGLTRSLASATLPPLPPPPGGTAAFFSCSAHQMAYEDAELQHGVFFHHIIEALKGDADSSTAKRKADGQITLAELSEHVSSGTYDFVRTKYNGAKQAPELKGEFRLTVPLIELKASQRQAGSLPHKEDITNSIGIKLKLIPAGEFLMGSPADEPNRSEDEGPQHKVRITQPYYLGVTEVTQGQWFAVMKTKPWEGKDSVKDGDNYPATYVSWDDAVEYCQKLSAAEGKTYRLPTEAEWEYACRGGKSSTYSFGTDASQLSNYGRFDENALNIDEIYAHEVGTKRANPFGLYDMHGNVWEWCSDWYDRDYSSSAGSDPPGASSGSYRVNRGGSWRDAAGNCRSAIRFWLDPSYRSYDLGFRLALSPSGQ